MNAILPPLILSVIAAPCLLQADDNPTSWEHAATEYTAPAGLVRGAAFIDRLLPMPVDSPLRADVWGGDNVKPRNAANGLEEPDWSYWCMSVFPHGGKEHMFATRWPEAAEKGHMAWPQSSIVHAVADKATGPFKVIREIGPGHNVMHYQTRDGTHVLYVIGRAYKSHSLDGPWEQFELQYHTRGFEEVVMSNHNSKIIALPMVMERRLEILPGPPAASGAAEIRIRHKAEAGFQPAADLDLESLRFGAPSAVDFGGGLQVLKSERAGADLILTFAEGEAGFTPDDFVGKLLGRDKRDGLVVGFARLPGVPTHTPIFSPSKPVLEGRDLLAVTVENFGLAASVPGRMKVVIQAASGETRAKEVVVPMPALAPYAKADLLVPIGSDWLPSSKPAKIDLILPSPTGVPLVATTTVTAP